MKIISQEHFQTWCRNYRAFDRYQIMHTAPRTWKTKVIILRGQSGCGKSHGAEVLARLYGEFYKLSNKWGDGYSMESAVVVDEFTGWLPFSMFKIMTDQYGYAVEIKGSFVPWVPKIIIFTTNTDPLEWYVDHLGKRDNYEAFIRRIDEYWVCNSFIWRLKEFGGWNGEPRDKYPDIGKKISAINNGEDFDTVMGPFTDVIV